MTSALILDSSPGRGLLQPAIQALAPNDRPAIYYSVYAALLAMHGLHWIKGDLVDGEPQYFVDMRHDLNSDNLLGWMNRKTPRVYLYSEKDKVVASETVEQHSDEARKKGFRVTMKKFEDTSHVSHAKAYPELYWTAVREVWNYAVESSRTRANTLARL
jgi:hypothetical protein